MKTDTFTLPAYLAGYLINGDISGLSDNELNEADKFMIDNQLDSCLTCSYDAFYTATNDLNNEGNNCLTYTFKLI